jgi:hypothetical protein
VKKLIIFLIFAMLLCGVALGMGNRPIFKKVYAAWKNSNYTVQQVMNATDAQVISHAGLDPNEIIQWNIWKRGIKNAAKSRIKAKLKEARRTAIIIPDATAIIAKLKAEGLSTVQAKAELLEVLKEELRP